MRLRRVRAWTVVAGLASVLLALFAVVEWAGVPVLVDPTPWLRSVSLVAGVVGVGLLVVDAFVPVPSSVVMVALGATFGLVGGIALSVLGSVGGFALAYAVGRRSRSTLESAVVLGDVERGSGLVRRWGLLAIVASRPVPLVAETVAISAGAFGLRPTPAFAAALAGAVAPATVFSYAGWRGATTGDGVALFAAVVGASVLLWVAGRRWSARTEGYA
ncbi:VTT domain-containing protein [Nostocoides sp. F2B08]|uniref:VTT domain-containing protein n=1 Tax=Nostocoides sp. F2B08 TaxID=2653936 RepID=UPI00186B15BA|nr:VTT domain-containing protein [Tetrasphaera sp. F2B08]